MEMWRNLVKNKLILSPKYKAIKAEIIFATTFTNLR